MKASENKAEQNHSKQREILRSVEKWQETVEKDLALAEEAAADVGKGVDFGLWTGRAQILRAEVGRIKGLRSQLEEIVFAFDCKES